MQLSCHSRESGNPQKELSGVLITLFFLASFMFIGNAAAQADITTGLVGYWKLSDGSGTTASDSSGNGNNGTLCSGIYNTSASCPASSGNGPTWYAGTKENALQLAGSNQANGSGQFVNIPNPATNISVIQPSQAITVSLWVYPTVSGGQTLFEMGGSYGVEMAGYNQDNTLTKFGVVLATSGFTWNYTHAIGGPINFNQWNHVAMTYTSGNLILYVNGAVAATDSSITGPITYPSTYETGAGGTSIGAGLSWGQPTRFFTGNIDDVRVYNRALSSTEIASIITNEPHDAAPPTISNFSVTNISSTSATINYSTNPASTTVISYGTSSSSLTSTTTADQSSTQHSQTLSNLTPLTTYYYTVTATSSVSGLQSTSAVQTFTTATGAFDQTQTVNENQFKTLTLGDPTDATARTIISNPQHGTVFPTGAPGVVTQASFSSLSLPNTLSQLWIDLQSNGYIDANGNIQDKFYNFFSTSFIVLNSAYTAYSLQNIQSIYNILEAAPLTKNTFNYAYVPRQNFFGTDTFTFQVGAGGAISTVTINVTKTPQAPVWTDDFPNIVFVVPSGESGVTQTFQISAMDPNNETLTYSVTGLPSNMSINSATGLITATGLSSGSSGLIASGKQVTVTNTDGASLTQTVNVYVRTPNDWYVAQTASGNGSGSCTNAQSIGWVDAYDSMTGLAGTNWGDGQDHIGPGDTIHLCGIISTGLEIWGSGIAGYPITISFDQPGAKMSAPYWPGYGAIYSYYYQKNFSYIVIDGILNFDGTTNGIIESTDNGTATMINPLTGKLYANQQNSTGIGTATGFTHFTVKNMTIRNMYVRAPDSFDNNGNGGGISLAGSNITIQNNIVVEADGSIVLNAGNNNLINGNTILDFNHGLTISPMGGKTIYYGGMSWGGINPMGQNLTVSNNRLDGWDVWECAGCAGEGPNAQGYNLPSLHNDGMIVMNESWGNGGAIINFYIFGNEIGPGINPDPNLVGNGTCAIFLDMYKPTQLENVYIYNNLMTIKNPLEWPDGASGAAGTHVLFANNTITGLGGVGAGGDDIHLYNNLLYLTGAATTMSGSNIYYDHNIYYNGAGSTGYNDFSTVSWNGTSLVSNILNNFEAWQALGLDLNSTLNQPLLDTNYVPLAGDTTAVGQAINLGNTSEGDIINWCDPAQAGPALCLDKNGFPRNSTWDIGAYQTTGNGSAYSISISRNPVTGGSVTCGPTPTSSPNPETIPGGVCPSEALAGTQVTFIAVPRTGYVLSGWTVTGATVVSGCVTTRTCTVAVNAATNVSANFTAPGMYSTPTVAFTNISNGTTVLGSSPVTLSASASTNQPFTSIQSVNFYVDGTVNGSGQGMYLIGNATLSNGSYNFTWDTTLQNNGVYTYDGSYMLTAIATDSAGVAGTPVSINVTIFHPTGSTAVNGSCGTAAKTYAYGSASFVIDNLCGNGITSPSNVAFPTAGNSVSWECLGVNGGQSSNTCTASQAAASSSGGLLGDVNSDGGVNIADAELTAQAAEGLISLTSTQQQAAGVDGTGQVDIYDAYLIAEYAAGLITKFPIQN